MTDRDEHVHTDTVTEAESPEPNELGFGGEGNTPTPAAKPDDAHAYAEETAVPGGDLTGAVSEALNPADGDR